MIFRLVYLCIGLFFSLSVPGFAAPIELFPHGKVVQEGRIQSNDYLVVAGRVKWVNNALRLDAEIRLNVTGQKRLQLIDPGHSSEQAFEFLQAQLEALQAKTIFVCEGRDCGASNIWANEVFHVARLYGKDREQFYALYALNYQGQQQFFAVYAIRRGNGRVYLYLEQLTPEKIPSAFARYFGDQNNSKDLIEVNISAKKPLHIFTNALFARIKARLAGQSDISLWLVCRMEGQSMAYADSVKASREMAESAQQWLIAKGVSAGRVNALGLGPFPLKYQNGGSTLTIHFVQD